MRGQRDICLLCRHTVRSLRPDGSAKRNASTKKQPYVLSSTVIDLDAMDSKFVKRFEDMEVGKPKSWQKPRNIAPPQIDPRWTKRAKKTYAKRTGQTFEETVTAPDFLSYALTGADSEKSPYWSHLRQLFKARRIQPMDNSETKLKKLMDGFSTNPSIVLERAGFSSQKPQVTKRELESCTSWSTLRRIVSTLSSTTKGCEFLAENSESLVHGIIECRKAWSKYSRTTPQDVLILINNLNLNFGARGIPLGPRLCNSGLYYAAKADSIPAVSMYLGMLMKNKYPTNSHTSRGLLSLVGHFVRKNFMDISFPDKEMRRQADLISTLVSGWGNDEGPSSDKKRQPSFADLVTHDSDGNLNTGFIDVHSTYLLGLGEMGYGQTLLHEWKRLGDSTLNNPAFSDRNRSAMAFILANNRSKALAILEAASADDVNAQAVDALEADDRPSHQHLIGKPFAKHYNLHQLIWKNDAEIVQKMRQPIPTDPTEAMRAIDNLLVTEYKLPKPDKHRAFVDWATVNGREGLQIKDGNGVELYFKPAV